MTILFRTAAVLLALATAYISLLPVTGEGSIPHADKVQHLLVYGLLSALIGLGWPRLRLPWVIAIASLFGVGVEIAQALAPTGRTASLLDALANLAGASIAAIILARFRVR